MVEGKKEMYFYSRLFLLEYSVLYKNSLIELRCSKQFLQSKIIASRVQVRRSELQTKCNLFHWCRNLGMYSKVITNMCDRRISCAWMYIPPHKSWTALNESNDNKHSKRYNLLVSSQNHM